MAYSKCFSTSVIRVVLVFVLCACSLSAQSALIDRGEGFIYDDVLDVTWAQDANIRDGEGIDGSGQDIWDNQVAWAAGYSQTHTVYGTFDDWRLPTALNGDGSDPCSGAGCTGSEMGHLFNVDGISSSSMGLFTNVQSDGYWSGTEYAPLTSFAWYFDFHYGNQGSIFKSNSYYALAVRDGDVAAVPVPAAVWLFGSALGLLGLMRRKAA